MFDCTPLIDRLSHRLSDDELRYVVYTICMFFKHAYKEVTYPEGE